MAQAHTTMARRWLVLVGALALAGAAQTATRDGRGKRSPVDKGPTETRQERDKRLQRECKGKPNAGACEGYTT
jgi:hypothetical protein